MEHPSIEVRLNTPATPAVAEELEPDAIVAALGARPVVPTFLKGYDQPFVVGAEEVYYDLSKAGQNVVVLGGGLVGCELAIHLSLNGRNVTILEMQPQPNFGGNDLHGQAVMEQLRIRGIQLHTNTAAREIGDHKVIACSNGEEAAFDADTIIYAVGQAPLRDEVEALRFCAPEFYVVGDCSRPANIQQATTQAYYAARDIGRI